jgi:type IV secretory system VirB8-like protein
MSVALEQNERNAARSYYEDFAGPVVTNTRLFIACVALSLCVITLAGLLAYAWHGLSHQKIVILQRSLDGSLDRAQYVDLGAYQPGEKEVEHFAYQYVVATYSRVRATLPADFANHLAFLPDDQRKSELAKEAQSKWIEAFGQSAEPEIRVNVLKVRYGGAQNRISVDFEKRFSVNGRENQDSKESWTVELAYTIAPDSEISGDLIPVNPLGMTIVETREAKGF